MKKTTLLLAMLVLLLAFGSGCSKKPVGPAGTEQSTESDTMSESELAAQQLQEAKRIIIDEKVYFAFNRSDLSEANREILKRKAQVLKQNSKLKVLIEGNCDERGTEEYNLALGERRARVAYKYLVNMGVDPAQLETVSFGEERPAVFGHNEESWAQNRRDEFRLVW